MGDSDDPRPSVRQGLTLQGPLPLLPASRPPTGNYGAVYFLWEGDELVYIGTTSNLFNRLSNHWHGVLTKGIKEGIDYWTAVVTDSNTPRATRWYRLGEERRLIETHNPRHNVAFRTNLPGAQ